jgi:hypothetical protein
MTQTPPLPLADYLRIYQVIYSVLQASEIATTHRACLFFTIAGTLLMRQHYGLNATITVGGAALMVNEKERRVVVYGRDREGAFVGESDAFHAWVQCEGWMIDFMAPILGAALREDGHDWVVPARMLQKRLADGAHAIGDIQHAGEFCLSPDAILAEQLIDRLSVGSTDLLKVCQAWFRPPPKPLKSMQIGSSQGTPKNLVLRAPAITGTW